MTDAFSCPKILYRATSQSPEKSQAIGRILGTCLDTAAVIAFHGDLGAGKTTLIQGLARGVGVADHYYITSPTYTLINSYPGRIPFHHIDLYRIGDVDELEGLINEVRELGAEAYPLADHLGQRVDRFQLGAILRLLEEVRYRE